MIARLVLATRFALRQLRGDALSAFLAAAMLGIGAGTITFVLSLGAMVAAEATRSLAALGPSVVSAILSYPDRGPPEPGEPGLATAGIARIAGGADVAALSVAYVQLRAGGRVRTAPIIGIEGPADRLLNIRLAEGRWADPAEPDRRDCIVGARLARDAPLGDMLLVRDRPCRVVGVLAPAPSNPLFPAEMDTAVLVARPAAARLDADAPVSQFLLRVPAEAEETTLRALLARYAAATWPNAGLLLRSSGELIATMREQYERQAQLFAVVAGVAIAAAAIGLCAMMLAQVRARRRELGVRLAVGALPGDIVLQILAEALLIGALAGLLGNLGALGLLGLVASVAGLPMEFDLPTAIGTTLGTIAAGALSGSAPAIVAARTDPVHSIRS